MVSRWLGRAVLALNAPACSEGTKQGLAYTLDEFRQPLKFAASDKSGEGITSAAQIGGCRSLQEQLAQFHAFEPLMRRLCLLLLVLANARRATLIIDLRSHSFLRDVRILIWWMCLRVWEPAVKL